MPSPFQVLDSLSIYVEISSPDTYFLKILPVSYYILGFRLIPACQFIVPSCLLQVPHPVMADTQGDRRQKPVAVFFYEGSGSRILPGPESLFIPEGCLGISPPLQEIPPQLATGLSPGNVIPQGAKQGVQLF